MKKNVSITALLLAIVFAGCQKEIQTEPSIIEMAKPGGSTSTSKDVFVSVTVSDFNENFNKISSDDHPDNVYTHNKDRVQAVIWASGEFFMNTNTTSNKAPIRRINFDFPDDPVGLNDVNNIRMRIVGIEDGLRLQDIENGHTKKARFWFWGEKPMGVFKWKLYYKGNFNTVNRLTFEQSDEVTVTRSADGKSWTIKSAGNETAVLHDINGNHVGDFIAPFELVLRAL